MRLAIFDNLANNAYILAKAFHRLGHPVDLVLNPTDRFAMSDPRWEDLDLELPTDSLDAASLPASEVPDWVRRPTAPPPGALHGLPAAARAPAITLAGARHAGPHGALLAALYARTVRTLRDYDCVMAFGFGPAIAALAGVPCVAEAFGGDVTIVPFADADPAAAPAAKAMARLQRLGLGRAGRIVAGDPGFHPSLERLGLGSKIAFVPTLVDTAKYTDGSEPELRRRLLGDRAEILIFVPARQDWHWKGSDAMLRGVASATRGRDDAMLVCAGWGADLERSRELAAELGLDDRIRFLPYALSKSRLLRYYRAADVVLDQFGVARSYGTSALEAMSCSRPVLIDLERERFERIFEVFPPVANCKAPEEIASALRELLDDPAHRRELGGRARDWVVAHHGDELVERQVELCREVGA